MKSLIGLIFTEAFPEGYFSKDFDMEGARVEAVGRDWVVVRMKSGTPRYQSFVGWSKKEIKASVREWCKIQQQAA